MKDLKKANTKYECKGHWRTVDICVTTLSLVDIYTYGTSIHFTSTCNAEGPGFDSQYVTKFISNIDTYSSVEEVENNALSRNLLFIPTRN